MHAVSATTETEQLAAKIELLKAQLERQRLENEIKKLEEQAAARRHRLGSEYTAQHPSSATATTATTTTTRPSPVKRKVIRKVIKRTVKKANGEIVTTVTHQDVQVEDTRPAILPPEQQQQEQGPPVNTASVSTPAWVAKRETRQMPPTPAPSTQNHPTPLQHLAASLPVSSHTNVSSDFPERVTPSLPRPVAAAMIAVPPLQPTQRPIQRPTTSSSPLTSSVSTNDRPVHPLASAFALGGGKDMAPKATVVESVAPDATRPTQQQPQPQKLIDAPQRPPTVQVNSEADTDSARPVHPLARAFVMGGSTGMASTPTIVEAISVRESVRATPSLRTTTPVTHPTASSASNVMPKAMSSVSRPVHPLAIAFSKGGGSATAPRPTIAEETSTNVSAQKFSLVSVVSSVPVTQTLPPASNRPVHPLAMAFARGGGSIMAPPTTDVVEAVSKGVRKKVSPMQTPSPPSGEIISGRPVHPLATAFARGDGSAMAPSNMDTVEALSTGAREQLSPIQTSPPPCAKTTSNRPVHPLAMAFAKGGGSSVAPTPLIVEATSSGPASRSNQTVLSPDTPPPEHPQMHSLAAAFVSAADSGQERLVHPLAAAFAGAAKPNLKSSNNTPTVLRSTGNPLMDAIAGGVKLKSTANASPAGPRPTGNPLMDAIAGGVKLKSAGPAAPKPSGNPLLAAIQAGVKLKPVSQRDSEASPKQHANPLVAALSAGVKLKSTSKIAPRSDPAVRGNPLAAAALVGLKNLKKTNRASAARQPAPSLNHNDALQQALTKRNALTSKAQEASPERTLPTTPTTPNLALQEAMAVRNILKSRSREASPERIVVPVNQHLFQSVQLNPRTAPEQVPLSWRSLPTNGALEETTEERHMLQYRENSSERVPVQPVNPTANALLKTTTQSKEQPKKIIKKVIRKKPKKVTPPQALPTQVEQEQALLAQIAKVEADIMARHKLEKEISEMEAMIAASQQAAMATPAAPTVPLRQVGLAPKRVIPKPSVAPSVPLRPVSTKSGV